MRARNLKPGIFKNEILAEADPLITLLFQGLWCLADRDGRLEDRPKKIKGEVFPFRTCDTDALLTFLHEHGFILRYVADGAKFIQIVNWNRHQRPHHTEKSSEIPAFQPHSGESALSNGESTLDNGEYPPSSLIPDSLIPDSLNGEQPPKPPENRMNGKPAPWLTRMWLHHLRRAPNRSESPPDVTKFFEEMLRLGGTPERIEAGIVSKDRDHTQTLWDFQRFLHPREPPRTATKPETELQRRRREVGGAA